VHIIFSKIIGYAVDVFPLIVLAETQLGPGGGETKKAYVRDVLGDITHVMCTRFVGAGEELHADVKQWRDSLIDISVDVANWRGLFPASMAQRIASGRGLGYVDASIAAIYKKSRKTKAHAGEETKWAAFEKSLPPTVVTSREPVAVP